MSDPMAGIEVDVVFDHEYADALIKACDDAADLIKNQVAARASWLAHGLEDFSGYYARLFERNGEVQASDASLVVMRLDEVAVAVGDLKRAARAEQERREIARAWRQRQDERGFWGDMAAFVWGQEEAPVGSPDPEPQFSVSPPPVRVREPLTGSGYTDVSSGRPANLRSFAMNSAAGNDELRPKVSGARMAYTNFVASCGWGVLEAAGVFSGFDAYVAANDNDVHWVNVVAGAFEAAGGDGVVTVPNAVITGGLEAGGVDAGRRDLEIDPPELFGAPPTTGYANDPVNTATGNFLEPETDVGFGGGCSALVWGRMYNSLNPVVGGFGPGWSSWTEAGLSVRDSVARWCLFDGRQVVFPRVGSGWGRAVTEAYWLESLEEGYRVSDNAGGWWRFDRAGRLTGFASGEGCGVSLVWEGGRLGRLVHERGRWIDVLWNNNDDEDEGGVGARVVGVVASDGRRVEYTYDETGRLIAAGSAGAVRRYEWDDAGFIVRVIDADGVVEVTNSYDPQGRVVEQVSQHGRVSRFSYLPGGVTVVADEDGARSNTWVHDARGRLVRIVDADGEATSLVRDGCGNIVLATERDGGVTASGFDDRSRLVVRVTPSGARVENVWDEQDRLVQVRVDAGDDAACVTSYEYEGDSRLPSRITDGVGGVTHLGWERGQLVRMTDPTGVEFHICYDEHGDVVAMADGAGNTSRLERDAAGRIVASITPSGHVTGYEWDDDWLVARVDPDGARWGFEYSPAGRLRASVDPLGTRTEVTHDSTGEVAEVVDGLGRVTRSFHDDLGNLAAMVLPDGRRWEYTHDALSRLVAVTDPEGARWEYTHDVMGHLTRQTDPTGRSWSVGYSKDRCETWQHPEGPNPPVTRQVTDRIGRVTATTGPHGGTHHTRYDACGRPIEHIDPDGGITALVRDVAGRVLQITSPDGAVTGYGYDPVTGRLASVTNPGGHTTIFVTDPDNRLVVEINPAGEETRYTYDPCGRVTEVVEPGRGRSTWRYDLCGRVVKTRDRFWGTRYFSYDAAGQLVEARDALGRTTRYTYDTGGRATTITDPLGHTTQRVFNHLDLNISETDPLGRTKHYSYDPAGRLIGHTRASGDRLGWCHDQAGQISQVIVNDQVVASWQHDWPHNTITIADHTDPKDPVTHRLRWDTSGRLIEQTRGSAVTRWDHDQMGRCVAVTAPNGHTSHRSYDFLGNCTQITTPAGDITHTYNPAGRLVEAHGPNTTHQTWDYLHGQVSRHHSEGPDGTHTTLIDRDPEGRITAVTHNGHTTHYTHDAAGQLTTMITPTGDTWQWVYDQVGQLIEEHHNTDITHYTHDPAGQLVEQRHPNGDTTHYTYNPDGKRTTEHSPHGTTTYTWNPLGWLTHITTPDATTTLHTNALSELARINTTTIYWNTPTQPLQIGTHTITTTPTGTAINTHWTPTGWRPEHTTTPTNPWTTPTPTTHNGIGITPNGTLHINGLEWLTHRTYHPTTRTFLTPDPLPPITATTTNPYTYTNNNPLHTHDPQGLRPVTDNELQDYNNSNGSRIFNWKTLTGAALTVGGFALGVVFPGVGTAIGGFVMGAGSSLLKQGTSGPSKELDWMDLGISTALGGVGGIISAKVVAPLAQRILGEGVSRFKDIGLHTLLEGGVGGITGAASGLINNIHSGTSITSADFWKKIGTSAMQGAAENAFGGAAGRGLQLRGVSNVKAGGAKPGTADSASLPAAGTADVSPSPATPELSTGTAPRRELIEPRRSSGIEAPTPGIPRRAMPDTEAGYSPLYPPPRRALPGDVLEETPI